MSNYSPAPSRVVWREGMLISPQHLQAQDRFFEHSMNFRFEASCGVSWGVVDINVDPAALASGQFSLQELRAVLADGTCVALGSTNAPCPPPVPIEAGFDPTSAKLPVFLAIPHEKAGQLNFDPSDLCALAPAAQAQIRFRVQAQECFDATREQSPMTLQLATPRPQIILGPQVPQDMACIQIARIQRSASQGFELDPSFVPACLHLGGSDYLQTALRETLGLATQRYRSLLSLRRQRDSRHLELLGQDLEHYAWMSRLGALIPALRFAQEHPQSAPIELYQLLAQSVGSLAPYGTTVDPTKIPSYLHHNLEQTFGPLFCMVNELIERDFGQGFVDLELQARSDGMWLARIEPERIQSCQQVILAVRTQLAEQSVSERLPNLAKIGSFSQIPDLIQSAVCGVALRPLHRPPLAIPQRPQTLYFEISAQDRYWQKVLSEGTVAFYAADLFEGDDYQVQLLAVTHH